MREVEGVLTIGSSGGACGSALDHDGHARDGLAVFTFYGSADASLLGKDGKADE